MTVFGKECRNIINDLSSDSGFFPVSQIGSWHSGIHISLNGMVECPVTGTVIDCNFSDMETSNYFVIESAITNKDQSVSYYSIISGLKSYKEMKERFEGEKRPDASAYPLNVILNYFADKGLPYGVKAKLCVKNYKSPYVTICGEQKILGSFFYLNSSMNTSSTEDGTITERFAYGKMEIQACKDNSEHAFGFINENIICENYTIEKGAEVSLLGNNTLRVKGSSKIKFKLEETAGFFDLKKNGKTIDNDGNISFKEKERVEFYEKKELFKENISLIDKAQLERISPLMAEIESEICAKRNYKILRSGQETPAKEQQYKMEESFERGRAILLEQELKILKRLRSFLEKEGNVAIVSKKVTPVGFYPMKVSLYDNIEKKLNVCIKYGTGNFAIYTADENLIVIDNFFLGAIKNSKNKFDLKDLPSHKEIWIVKKRKFDEHITGLKSIVDGKGQNSRPDCYNGKSVCECRPYMFNIAINDEQKKHVFLKHRITGWEDENVMKKDGIYVYSQDNQSFPSRILESDEEILAIESANETDLKVTLRSGTAYCGRDDCSLQIEISDDKGFIGKTIGKGTYLGDANENYVDWAMFFKETIIDELKKMKRQRLCIPKGTACRKKVCANKSNDDGAMETEDCASLPEDYHDNDYHDGKYNQIKLSDANGIAKDYFEITQGNETYYIDNEILGNEGVVTDHIKQYRDSLIPLNFGSSIADESICPASKSLVCKLPELKEKLKDIDLPNGKGKLGACLDKKQSNYLYRPDCIDDSYPVQALSSKKYKDAVLYTSRLVSRHPMEFDADLYDRCCSDLGLCSSPSESHDIYNRIKDRLNASENSFYFLYPPDFMSMLDDAGLLEFNPYEGKTYENVYNPSWSMTESMKKLVIINNPGFAPYVGKSEHNINGYAVINWHFREKNKYYHEGVDFFGVRKGNTPVKALVFGKVVFFKDQGFYHYGKSILIKTYKQEDGKNIFYLLGHLDHYAEGIKEGATIQIGQVVGYVGNTGHCSSNVDLNGNGNGGDLYPKQRADGYGTHLHVTLYKTNKTELDFDFVPDLIKGTTSYPTTDRFDPFNHKRGYN